MIERNMQLTTDQLTAIMDRYDTDLLQVSMAYRDATTDPLRGRLERALLDQIESPDAMASRYAIWANTVRDNIIAGMNAIEAGKSEEGFRFLIRAANSLSAFSDAQAYLDPQNSGART